LIQALVTGSDGFIGSHLVKRLDELGLDLVCVDKAPKTDRSLKMDVASKEFLNYFRDQKFDYVFHLGSPCSILQFNENPRYCIVNTMMGFENALKLAEKTNAKLVYPSSGNVYGSQKLLCREIDAPFPVNMYGYSKLICESIAQYSSVDTLGLRIFCGYGCGEEMKRCLGSVVYLFLKNMMNGKNPVIWGDGYQMRDFIYIDDIIEGIIGAINITGIKVLNLASGTSVTYNELVKVINRVLGTEIQPMYVEKPLGYVDKTFADISLMRSTLKLSLTSLEGGIKLFSEYLRARYT